MYNAISFIIHVRSIASAGEVSWIEFGRDSLDVLHQTRELAGEHRLEGVFIRHIYKFVVLIK